jgi:hypothetical protein
VSNVEWNGVRTTSQATGAKAPLISDDFRKRQMFHDLAFMFEKK